MAYGNTRKDTLLKSVPLGSTTWTSPVVTPAGTVVVISELDTTVKIAALPLKVTLVDPVRLLPRMLTSRSHLRGGRLGFHKWPQTYRQAEDRANPCRWSHHRLLSRTRFHLWLEPAPLPGIGHPCNHFVSKSCKASSACHLG